MTTPFESYCATSVKATVTYRGLEEDCAYHIREILDIQWLVMIRKAQTLMNNKPRAVPE